MSNFHVAIVGAGLVGSLAAISFARQGYTVTLFDAREDPRNKATASGRSINLAVSARGLGAIRSIDAAFCDRLVEKSIPMIGRMIHVDGKEQSQIYGLFGETINSIDRAQLNIDLLNEADSYSSVVIEFDHKLQSIDFTEDTLTFGVKVKDSSRRAVTIRADLTIGCDGAYSAVRTAMMKAQRMNFSQEYIEHAYLELSILPSDSGNYKLAPDHLHIWPRQEFMLIALPNPDKSFTSTLFAPFKLFDSLESSHDLVEFFKVNFPDALALIGEQRLIKIWETNPVAPLIQIKCSPYHLQNKAILLGDSTHAMVPFYGQGMNCGFEDLRILNEILQKYNISPSATWELSDALSEYSHARHDDLLAILKLAMGNYTEMRSTVTSRLYLLKKRLDQVLGRLFKDKWIPMYSMVSFRDDISYSDVIRRDQSQTRVLNTILGCTAAIICSSLVALTLSRFGLRFSRNMVRDSLSRLARSI